MFVLLEETGVPGGNPCTHTEKMQTPPVNEAPVSHKSLNPKSTTEYKTYISYQVRKTQDPKSDFDVCLGM